MSNKLKPIMVLRIANTDMRVEWYPGDPRPVFHNFAFDVAKLPKGMALSDRLGAFGCVFNMNGEGMCLGPEPDTGGEGE